MPVPARSKDHTCCNGFAEGSLRCCQAVAALVKQRAGRIYADRALIVHKSYEDQLGRGAFGAAGLHGLDCPAQPVLNRPKNPFGNRYLVDQSGAVGCCPHNDPLTGPEEVFP